VADDLLGRLHIEGLLAPQLARAQHVQRQPGHHGGQPRRKVLHAARVGATGTQPCFLHGVIGLTRRAEHPVRHRPEAGPLLLETAQQPFTVVHRVTFLPREVSQK
jgi:hypothetical protein